MKDASGDSAWPGTTQFLAFGLALFSPYPPSLVWSTRRLGVAADGIASRLAVVVVGGGRGQEGSRTSLELQTLPPESVAPGLS